jgi:large subunit ribosomal protein L9
MELILLKNVDKVGDKYEIVTVKNGYGRNYLIPQGFAMVANDSNRRSLASLVSAQEKREAKMVGEYQAMATKLADSTLTITAKAGTSGRLFGSVNAATLASALRQQLEIDVERKKIALEDIKETGAYTATITFHKDVVATANFNVVAEVAAA